MNAADFSGQKGMEGADCADFEGEEQAVLLVDDVSGQVTVVQPNEDGSYWRKIVRNKMIRMKEKRRIEAAERFVKDAAAEIGLNPEEFNGRVVSSWGPYTSISGTASKTAVAGLTAAAELKAASNWQQVASSSEGAVEWVVTGSQLKDAFSKLDTDGDGLISVKELSVAIKAVVPTASDEEVDQMVALADGNGDGDVTLDEFAMLMLFKSYPPKETSLSKSR